MATTPSVLTREAGTSTPTLRSVRRRLSLSHALIGLAALLAFAFNYVALQSRDDSTLVAVASAPIAEGTRLSSDLVRLSPLPADFDGMSNLMTEQELSRLEGWVVSREVAEGELIHRTVLIELGAGDGLRTMSVPVPIEHAAGATIVTGDRVDIIALVDEVPTFVGTDLQVTSIAETSQGGLSGVGPYFIVVAVTSDQALALAGAIEAGSLEIIRSTGSVSADGGSE